MAMAEATKVSSSPIFSFILEFGLKSTYMSLWALLAGFWAKKPSQLANIEALVFLSSTGLFW